MISFKWRHFEQTVIMMAVRWYVAYPLSYRNIEELMLERGVNVDHSTISRWVVKYSPQLERKFIQKHKHPVGFSWRVDETYIKIKGVWYYLYRALDKAGDTVDFLLCKHRDNKAALDTINDGLLLTFFYTAFLHKISIRQIKYLNNIVEQDHRFIKKIIRPMLGFKKFRTARATLYGIELHHMLRKGQHINAQNMTIFEQFYNLAA